MSPRSSAERPGSSGLASDDIVVTGLGAVTAIGCHPGGFWNNLVAGKVGVHESRLPKSLGQLGRPVYSILESEFPCAGADDLAPGSGRASRLAVAASALALDDAALHGGSFDPRATGVAVGSGHGDTAVMEERLLEARPDGVGGDDFQGIADAIASRWGFWGPSFVVATACSSGLYAVLDAVDRLRSGEAEMMLAGGTEALAPSLILFFGQLFMRGPDVCRPFDRDRKGMVVGEGAAMLVLESAAHAERRGARPLAKIAGGAINCDAYDVTGMHVDRVAACLRAALADARLEPHDVDHVSAHGSGTRLNDVNEVQALKAVYGAHAYRLAVSGIKSMIGHTSGASGAIALVAAALSLQNGVVPPTANYRVPDPECDVDVVPNRARAMRLRAAQVNAFGFGGSNASVIATAIGTAAIEDP